MTTEHLTIISLVLGLFVTVGTIIWAASKLGAQVTFNVEKLSRDFNALNNTLKELTKTIADIDKRVAILERLEEDHK